MLKNNSTLDFLTVQRTRPIGRPKSEFITTPSAHQRYPSIGNVLNQAVVMINPAELSSQFTFYPLPGDRLNTVNTSKGTLTLPLLTVQDLRTYFSDLNDLRKHPQIQYYNEFLRFIYPPAWIFPQGSSIFTLPELDQKTIDRLRSHVGRSIIQEHWLFWIKQLETIVNSWEGAVELLGEEVKSYTSVPYSLRKPPSVPINLLDTYATKGINEFVEWNLSLATKLMEFPIANDSLIGPLNIRKERSRLEKLWEKMYQAKEKRKMWERKYRGFE